MQISEEYIQLMKHYNLPEAFRAGDFGITEYDASVLEDFVDSFYSSVEANGYVTLEDFTEFMGFLFILWPANTEAIQLILMKAFMKSAEIESRIRVGPNPYV